MQCAECVILLLFPVSVQSLPASPAYGDLTITSTAVCKVECAACVKMSAGLRLGNDGTRTSQCVSCE
eukprot:4410340-Heterocapsa_arctica.AAC.1